jgi:hypothetical protein
MLVRLKASEFHQKPGIPATAAEVFGRYLFNKGPATATTVTGESTKGLFSDIWLFILRVAAFYYMAHAAVKGSKPGLPRIATRNIKLVDGVGRRLLLLVLFTVQAW